MAYNKDFIIESYKAIDEEARASASLADSLEFYYTKKVLGEYIHSDASIIELGCGTGYYGAFLADQCGSYLGIDINPDHIQQFQAKIDDNRWANVSAQLGDATSLAGIPDKAYDVVLVLGPMYHLPPKDRETVMAESKRVCRDGGTILFAYINKVGAYLRGCTMEGIKHKYPNRQANELVLKLGVDDVLPDVFFFTMPEEMEEMAVRNGLTVLQNMGVNFAFHAEEVNRMSHDRLDAWLELTEYMMAHRSCTGVSNHALLVCKKS